LDSLRSQQSAYSLESNSIIAEFGSAEQGFPLLQIVNKLDKSKPYSFLLEWEANYTVYPQLWQIELVGEDGLQYVLDSSTTPCTSRKVYNTTTSLTFIYTLSQFPVTINATIAFNHTQTGVLYGALNFYFSSQIDPSATVCLMQVSYPVIAGLGSNHPNNDTFFYPIDYGQVWNNPGHRGINFPANLYPSDRTTFQYMAYYHNNISGLYWATHDGSGYSKALGFNSDSYAGTNSSHLPHSDSSFIHYPGDTCDNRHGRPINLKWSMPYPVVLASFLGSWWDSAQLYRSWVLPNAVWTSKGPVMQRADTPQWLLQNNLWLNTNWLPGVLNCTDGDPSLVLPTVLAAQKAFNQTQQPSGMSVHWYCWESSPFDTNYPDYLPAKAGFAEAVATLQQQAQAVHIVPYINGRLYDYNAPSYLPSGAANWAAKYSAPRMNPRTVQQNVEVYGSGQSMTAMCPWTAFWQQTMANVTEGIAVGLNTSGLYIDQIGAAAPYLCADPTHGHPTLGGDYWASGYRTLLQQVQKINGNQRMVITEEMAEPYMNQVQAYLSLSPYSQCNMVPAYMAVYGGYHISVGRTFDKSDLLDRGQGFAMKMGQMFVYGAQLGWMALRGRDGIDEILNVDKYQAVLNYTYQLTAYRSLVRDYVVGGRLMAPLPMWLGSRNNFSIEVNSCEPYPIVQAAIWQQLGNSTSLAGLFTNASPTLSETIDVKLDLNDYQVLEGNYVVQRILYTGETEWLGSFPWPFVLLSQELRPLETLVVTVTKA